MIPRTFLTVLVGSGLVAALACSDAEEASLTGSSAGSAGAGGSAGSTSSEGGAGEGASAGEGGGGGVGLSPELACLSGTPCNGYTLIGSPANDAGSEFTAMLIDMQGNLVHRWGITGFPPKMLPGGSLIGCIGVYPTSYDCVEMQQRSWDGDLEWSFSGWVTGPSAARHHHDMQREGNPLGFYAPGQDFAPQGTTLVLAHQRKTVPAIRPEQIDDDVIYEVDFNGELTGFEWHGADHFEEFGFDDAAKNDIATRPPMTGTILEWLHGNALALLGPNHWFDEGRSEFHPDNLIYSSRHANLVVIISRETGQLVWRIGPDFAGRPEEALGQFVGQHHAHMIPRGLPGAGNILVFDNGGTSGFGGTAANPNAYRYSRNYSRVLEFNPVTFEVVWQYGSASGADQLSSNLLSSAQRLPNGNTLITEGQPGRLLEVTPEKQIVWEYQYDGPGEGRADWVYRSYRIPPEWLPEGVNEEHGNYASYKAQFEN